MDNRKYKIISFFDECRWGNTENYGELNAINSNQEENLLTYWITYIVDRRADYKKVWEIGGFVFSKLVKQYSKTDTKIEELLDYRKKESFFHKIPRETKKSKQGYSFVTEISKEEYDKEFRYTNNKYKEENKYYLYYTPTLYLEEYVSIYRTFYILETLKMSFIDYIRTIIEITDSKDGKQFIDNLAKGLYFLTYYDIKKKNKEEPDEKYIENNKNYIEMKLKNIKKKDLVEIIKDKKFQNNFENKRYNNKRLWCTVRDFIKSDRYNFIVLNELKKRNIEKEDVVKCLELPGDVWNNKPQFRECLFKDEDASTKFNIFLRNIYNKKNEKQEWYPEQFDVTFDFTRRMCSEGKCKICPFSAPEEIEKICTKGKNGSYCTVALICCGYKIECNKIKKNSKGECKLLEAIRKSDKI